MAQSVFRRGAADEAAAMSNSTPKMNAVPRRARTLDERIALAEHCADVSIARLEDALHDTRRAVSPARWVERHPVVWLGLAFGLGLFYGRSRR